MIIKSSNGDLHAILNFGKPSDGSNIDWHDVGQTFAGTGTSNLTFADLNNDGRDDIIIFNADGSLDGFLNIRGLEEGRPMWIRQDNIKTTESWAPPNLRISDVTGLSAMSDSGCPRLTMHYHRRRTSRLHPCGSSIWRLHFVRQ